MDALPIRYSKRAKNMSIVVHFDGRWEVVVPESRRVSEGVIRHYVAKHRSWLEAQLARTAKNVDKQSLTHRGIPRVTIEQCTLLFIEETVLRLRRLHPVTIEHIRLGNYKAQWGSCSSGMKLGFHYKLSLLPKHLAEYVVAHELAHTTHFNHSKAFWQLVDRLSPNAKACRKELRQYVL